MPAMLRSLFGCLLVMTSFPVTGAPSDSAAARLRKVIQAHDRGTQVAALEGSPVSGLYLTSIDGVSG